MKLARLRHDPGVLADFYSEALQHCGALCERTWYDRLDVVAEGPTARLWNDSGGLYQTELRFPSIETEGALEVGRDVFPGCPLTFRLAEKLNAKPMTLERLVMATNSTASRPPSMDVAEKTWKNRWPGCLRWRLEAPFAAGFHFSLLTLVRCEIQAMDQRWSLHRVAISLPNGELDDALAADSFLEPAPPDAPLPSWPTPDPAAWHELLSAGIQADFREELAEVRVRQARYLRRELERVDQYFEGYARELETRKSRGWTDREVAAAKLQQLTDRLKAAKAEHERRRQDQVHRHEIRVVPHLDALMLIGEPAWQTTVSMVEDHRVQSVRSHFVPRTRRWYRESHVVAT